MKNPPSASVNPPIHTTQRVPRVSSKPRSGGGGGAAGALPAVSFASADAAAAGTMDSTSGASGGGSGGTLGAVGVGVCANSCPDGSGGGTSLAAAAGIASIASSRARSAATWFIALRAKINATSAITSEKKSSGESNIRPPGGRVRSLTDPFHGPSQSSECRFSS